MPDIHECKHPEKRSMYQVRYNQEIGWLTVRCMNCDKERTFIKVEPVNSLGAAYVLERRLAAHIVRLRRLNNSPAVQKEVPRPPKGSWRVGGVWFRRLVIPSPPIP